MVFITEELIRKRSEHNECQISTLEEISLHQLDIERIEYIDKWCRELKILYLQSNLIPKLENLSKLKKLEYLNLALNNITVIENLEGCESLTKLDLTINFIGKITSVESLKKNSFLRDLYLTGNPCADYIDYRDYVVSALPQLTRLDGKEISKSERIVAVQDYQSFKCEMLRQEAMYVKKAEKQKENNNEQKEMDEGMVGYHGDQDKVTQNTDLKNAKPESKHEDDDFWSKPTPYTPESRLETHRYMEEKRKEKEADKASYPNPNVAKRELRFFTDDGRPLNINQAKLEFQLSDDEEDGVYVLDISCYKHMDTSLIDVDVQPNYVRVTMKGNVLQLVMNEDISPSVSTTKRSQTTGHLVLTLPKLKTVLKRSLKKSNKTNKANKRRESFKGHMTTDENSKSKVEGRHLEKLEIDEKLSKVDIYNIVKDDNDNAVQRTKKFLFSGTKKLEPIIKDSESSFVDDPDVPPLE